MPAHFDVVVTGAGISGLACAKRIKDLRPETSLALWEASERAGGYIRSERINDVLVEWGPNAFLGYEPRTLRLAHSLGLVEQIVEASAQAKARYVVVGGKLRYAGPNPLKMLFGAGPFSLFGVLRFLTAPWRSRAAREEVVREAVARRFGKEAATILADALCTGIYAGDPDKLSFSAAFPRFAEVDSKIAGLRSLRDAKVTPKEPALVAAFPRRGLCTFRGGMQSLTDALAADLEPHLQFKSDLQSAQFEQGRWHLRRRSGEEVICDQLVLAIPAGGYPDDLKSLLQADALGVARIDIAVLQLAFRREQIANDVQGFGLLVPRGQGIRILGCVFESSVFPARAPEGMASLRVMLGGAQDTAIFDLPDDELVAITLNDLRMLLGVQGEPQFHALHRHRSSIPQYVLGHENRIRALDDSRVRTPGLHIIGNNFRGVSLNDCVAEGERIAERLVAKMG